MPTYIMLTKFTQAGMEQIKNVQQRMEQVHNMLKTFGVERKATYFTFGRYDGVAIFEAPSDEAMAKAVLSTASGGTIHAETLKAFTESEGYEIIKGL